MTQARTGTLLRCLELPEDMRLQAAKLAADALPAVYDAVGPESLPVLAAEFLLAEGELGNAEALVGEEVEGLVAFYPSAEYHDRQRASLHHALGNLERDAGIRLVARLRDLAGTTPEEELQGDYIARFAVRTDLRGAGVADRLMQLFLAGRSVVSLHVRRDNHRAIAFYRRFGFSERARSRDLILMLRD